MQLGDTRKLSIAENFLLFFKKSFFIHLVAVTLLVIQF